MSYSLYTAYSTSYSLYTTNIASYSLYTAYIARYGTIYILLTLRAAVLFIYYLHPDEQLALTLTGRPLDVMNVELR